MTSDAVARKLTTIFAADVVGYSQLMAVDEEATLKTLRTYRKVIDALIDQHGGGVFNSAGDFGITITDRAGNLRARLSGRIADDIGRGRFEGVKPGCVGTVQLVRSD